MKTVLLAVMAILLAGCASKKGAMAEPPPTYLNDNMVRVLNES